MSPEDDRDLGDSDAIIRITSYHRTDFDSEVVKAEPGVHDPVRLSLFKASGTTGSLELGRLQCLPSELISSICLALDVRSALAFSHANRGTREIIGSIPQYRQLSKHALECLWALLQTGRARHIGISTLYTTLSTEYCINCGSFGGFVFLPTATRCCYRCIQEDSAFRMVSLSSLIGECGLSHSRLKSFHGALLSIPGRYGFERKSQRMRRYLISEQQAAEFLEAYGDKDPERTARLLASSYIWRPMAATSLPYVCPATGDAQLGRSCKGCLIRLETNLRDEDFYRVSQERPFSREGFLDHFRGCKEAQELWLSSKGGTVAVKEPRFMKLKGG